MAVKLARRQRINNGLTPATLTERFMREFNLRNVTLMVAAASRLYLETS